MNCTHCGAQLPSDAKFCASCAHPVSAPVTATNPSQITTAPAPIKPEFAPTIIWKRLVNYIVDHIGIWIITFLLFFLIALLIPAFARWANTESVGYSLVSSIVVLLLSVLYFVIFEGILQKTPAKYITKTKVVMRDGSKPPLKNIIGRSFARLIPFDQFSFLFGANPVGWHDSLSKTMVVPSSYTPEDVKKIDAASLKGTGKNTALTVVIVVVAILVVIAVIGILSSVVLVSLNSARGKGKDATIRSTLTSIRPMIEMYNADGTSPKATANTCYQGVFATAGIALSISAINMYQPVCFASKNEYAVSAQLVSVKESFCIDASGYGGTGVAVSDTNGPHCERVDLPQTSSMLTPPVAANWQTFVSKKDMFSVLLPAVPIFSTKRRSFSTITMDANQYDSKTIDSSYTVMKIIYSIPIITSDEDAKGALKSILDGMTEADTKSVLQSSGYGTFQGHMSLDYVIHNREERLTGKIFVLDSSNVVVFLVDTSIKGFKQSEYDSFVSSFKSL